MPCQRSVTGKVSGSAAEAVLRKVGATRFRALAYDSARSMSELPPFLIKLIIAAINGAISAVVKVLVEHLFDD